uniref:Uncharacterized protein n=1 Tax=Arundo donax TaxID=35708 RepID=A0A0A9HS68_ARUDO
MLLVHTRLV